jgi:hypothetical protein
MALIFNEVQESAYAVLCFQETKNRDFDLNLLEVSAQGTLTVLLCAFCGLIRRNSSSVEK